MSIEKDSDRERQKDLSLKYPIPARWSSTENARSIMDL